MAKNEMTIFDWIGVVLLIVGGLVWGILGIFDINLVYVVFGMTWISRVIFSLVGVASVYSVWSLYRSGRK